jgi:uncharacterized YigZ family protein
MCNFKTISKTSTAIYKEKGSTFIAYAKKTENEEEAKDFIEEISKKHHKARHVCFAYIIGNKTPLIRSNDDGEPANTAGMPILNQLNKYGLKNITMIVVRYFGGVLLGKGGLIKAYGSVAEEAIRTATVIEDHEKTEFIISFSVKDHHRILQIIKKHGAFIIEESYAESYTMTIECRENLFKVLKKELSGISNMM